MSRLADPTTCPDCRAGLTTGAGRCPRCDLVLAGPLAAELWRTMLQADLLVRRLRAEAPASVTSAPPAPPAVATARPRPAVTGRSVSVVLLALGGLCLLVFAAIFLGVAWSVLGLAGRTLVMAGITAGLLALATGLTRRGLRASAETLWVVAGGILLLDVLAASAAGLLGDLAGRGTSTVAGLTLVVTGTVAAAWSSRTRTGTLLAPQGLAALGLGLATAAQLGGRPDVALPATLALPVALLAAGGAHRLGLRVAAVGSLAVGGTLWAVLLGAGLDRASVIGAPGAWWWPLLAAAAWAAAAVAVLERRAAGPGWTRSLVAGASLLPLVVALCSPALTQGRTTPAVLTGALTLVLLLPVVAWTPATWSRAATVIASVGSALLLAWLAAATATVGLASQAHPAAWPVLAVVLAVAGVVLGRVAPSHLGRARRLSPATPGLAVSCVALGAWAGLLALRPGAVVAVASGLLLTAVLAVTTWARWRGTLPPAVVGAAAATWTAALSLVHAARVPGEPLLAVALTVLAVPLLVAGLALDRADLRRHALLATVATAVGVLLGGAAVLAWCDQAGNTDPRTALVLAAYAAGVVVLAAAATRTTPTRAALQLAAVAPGLVALLVAGDATTGSRTLAVVAAGAAVGTLLQRLRGLPVTVVAPVAAAGAALASAWRATAGLPAPELASLPAGLLLVGAGLVALVHDRRTASAPALLPGLVAVVLPSTLLALGDPVSVRGLVVAVVAVGLLVVGVGTRLAAPFVVGAASAALLVVAHLEPVAAAVPRWLVIGVVGALLLAAGISWEAGLRRLSDARRYVASLR